MGEDFNISNTIQPKEITYKIQDVQIKDNLKHENLEILTIVIHYPQISSFDVINSFYIKMVEQYSIYLYNELYQFAISEYNIDSDSKKRFRHKGYNSLLTYKVTYQSDKIISLYFDIQVFKAGVLIQYKRVSQTWNLTFLNIMPIYDLTPINRSIKQLLRKPECDNFYLYKDKFCFYQNLFTGESAPTRRSEYNKFIQETLLPFSEMIKLKYEL